MNPIEFNPSWLTFAIVILVGMTAWYLWLIKLSLKEEREIELIFNKLERFYIPLQYAIFSIRKSEDNTRRDYLKAKAIALNNIVEKVNYHNLSSTELRLLIRRFRTKIHLSNYPGDLANDAEMAHLLDKIEALISRDIKEFNRKLNESSYAAVI
jgi:hypothetical protein